ncbi:helix-turn-helix transcriptional regulator [Geomonas nitrogeniifigens]|uniref:Helix-turn-helix transcriptional regulator n=1 Tax=Geomonas diazotrophica TaxID=2843197 RepID=A0ABX8JFB5_9BACT|nr:helix-turn-helix transcriptional regulator [Geomonas nitrogeniifigens]QWV96433.1 helix-turn-helix transcriptional regulator [Geomonas nitrogeniifigens]QXE85497.1 helix-turn-helix transcriptional regulator [Geomonas nitrogeniifigens]
MANLLDIVYSRGTPGILIFNLAGDLIFSNEVAIEMQVVTPGDGHKQGWVHDGIKNLLQSVFNYSTDDFACRAEHQNVVNAGKLPYSARPFLIGGDGKGRMQTCILVLVEKVVKEHEVNVARSRQKFRLTKREAEVAKFISKGFSNREISDKLFISEFTVKNHLKQIMKKTGATARSQIFALLQ